MATIEKHEAQTTTTTQLPDDLLMEILPRLPVKSLCRFKCVSKAWHAVLTDDHNRKRLPPAMSGIFYHPEFTKRAMYFDGRSNRFEPVESMMSFLPPHENIEVRDSSKGLLLCFCWDTDYSDGQLYVCNPATKRWAKIPPPPKFNTAALAFDPHRSPNYKVVTIRYFLNDDGFFIDLGILSSETGEWTMFRHLKAFDRFSSEEPLVFFNGSIHVLDCGEKIIMAVDLEGKVCRRMELPQMTKEEEFNAGLVGLVAGCFRCALQTREQIFIWDLEDYDRNKWNLKYTIRSPDIEEKVENPSRCLWVAALHPDLDVIFLCDDDKLFAYHLTSSNVLGSGTIREKKLDRSCPSNFLYSNFFYPYSPSYSENVNL